MVMNTIKCLCGCNNFEVVNNKYGIPRGFYLSCESCGIITPLGVYDVSGSLYEIIGDRTKYLYDESFCRDITYKEAKIAYYSDLNDSHPLPSN